MDEHTSKNHHLKKVFNMKDKPNKPTVKSNMNETGSIQGEKQIVSMFIEN